MTIEKGLESIDALSVNELVNLCEALDVLRKPELEKAAQLLIDEPLADSHLRGQYFMAKALANSGRQEASWRLLAQTVNAARDEVGAVTVYIDSLMGLATASLKAGDASQSIALATEAFNLSQESNYGKGVATSCNHFGSMKLQQGDVEGAVEYLNEAVEHAKPLNSQVLDYSIYSNLGIAYMLQGEFGEALRYFAQTLKQCKDSGHKTGEALTCINIANLYTGQGNYPKALEHTYAALTIYQELGDEPSIGYALGMLGDINKELGHYNVAAEYYAKVLEQRQANSDLFGEATACYQLGSVTALLGNHDKAAEYLLRALEICEAKGYISLMANVFLELGELHTLQGRYQDAEEALQLGSKHAETSGHKHLHNKFLLYNGRLEVARNQPDMALPLLLSGFELATELGLEDDLCKLSLLLSQCYEELGKTAEALKYYKQYHELNQKLQGAESTRLIASMQYSHQIEQKTQEAEIERLKHVELKKAYDELKQAQTRLVQQEKLVSLGRLVTGIAHELQNPLNFVTNFSSLSLEMVEELNTITDKEERAEIIQDIVDNLAKVNVHGNRAGAIVKGMLELKRDRNGAPQPLLLSRLVNEFVPLAWNNYRSKCTDLKVDILIFPPEKEVAARVVSVDLGRALISIVNNALDAVRESVAVQGDMYKPTIQVTLAAEGDNALITITDNGQGIPKDKLVLIFEPFYTTKTTGSGNIGLGLSLAHDMIVAQGGGIKVDSEPGFGTSFTISLPLAEVEHAH